MKLFAQLYSKDRPTFWTNENRFKFTKYEELEVPYYDFRFRTKIGWY